MFRHSRQKAIELLPLRIGQARQRVDRLRMITRGILRQRGELGAPSGGEEDAYITAVYRVGFAFDPAVPGERVDQAGRSRPVAEECLGDLSGMYMSSLPEQRQQSRLLDVDPILKQRGF